MVKSGICCSCDRLVIIVVLTKEKPDLEYRTMSCNKLYILTHLIVYLYWRHFATVLLFIVLSSRLTQAASSYIIF